MSDGSGGHPGTDEVGDADDRDVSPFSVTGDGDFDTNLRPRSLGDFIGQPRVC